AWRKILNLTFIDNSLWVCNNGVRPFEMKHFRRTAMVPIKFVTDSAADIPRALREELGIQVLPFPIAMGNKELQDGYDFTPEEFYPMLLSAAQIPTHAQLNPFVFSQCFQEAWVGI